MTLYLRGYFNYILIHNNKAKDPTSQERDRDRDTCKNISFASQCRDVRFLGSHKCNTLYLFILQNTYEYPLTGSKWVTRFETTHCTPNHSWMLRPSLPKAQAERCTIIPRKTSFSTHSTTGSLAPALMAAAIARSANCLCT